jgi:hypothetical protein
MFTASASKYAPELRKLGIYPTLRTEPCPSITVEQVLGVGWFCGAHRVKETVHERLPFF